MDLQQLRYFQAVARLGHMTRAAEALYVSQPALSRSIAQLERELGVPLFDRQGRGLRLNQYGEILLRRVEFAFEDLERARREIADLRDPEQGVVRLGLSQQSGHWLLAPLLGQFRQAHPRVRVRFAEAAEDAGFALLRRLEEGDLDLCWCERPRPDLVQGLQVTWQPALCAELALVIPPHHPWAGHDRIALAEAAAEPFVALPPGSALRTLADSLCQQAGFEADVVVEADGFALLWELVACGIGIALLPDGTPPAVARSAAEGWEHPVLVRLEGETARWTIGLAWSAWAQPSAATYLLRDYLLAHFDRPRRAGGRRARPTMGRGARRDVDRTRARIEHGAM